MLALPGAELSILPVWKAPRQPAQPTPPRKSTQQYNFRPGITGVKDPQPAAPHPERGPRAPSIRSSTADGWERTSFPSSLSGFRLHREPAPPKTQQSERSLIKILKNLSSSLHLLGHSHALSPSRGNRVHPGQIPPRPASSIARRRRHSLRARDRPRRRTQIHRRIHLLQSRRPRPARPLGQRAAQLLRRSGPAQRPGHQPAGHRHGRCRGRPLERRSHRRRHPHRQRPAQRRRQRRQHRGQHLRPDHRSPPTSPPPPPAIRSPSSTTPTARSSTPSSAPPPASPPVARTTASASGWTTSTPTPPSPTPSSCSTASAPPTPTCSR